MLHRLLDSVILIDHFNGIDEATNFISRLDPSMTAISVVTRAEILVGFDEKDAEKPKALLDRFVFLNIDKATADKAAMLRRTYRRKLPDAFQAALAILSKIKLSTRNTKDFDPYKHDFVEIPYLI